MKYTALLRYPEYSDRSTETCLAHVEASGPVIARVLAQQEVAGEYPWHEFKVLFITEGYYKEFK